MALLIEDDERLAELTREYLVGHGISVTHRTRAEDGLSELRDLRYDVVLLDLMLPGMDGLTACRQIREISDVPIIVLTARGEEADRVMGLEPGFGRTSGGSEDKWAPRCARSGAVTSRSTPPDAKPATEASSSSSPAMSSICCGCWRSVPVGFSRGRR